MQRNVGGGEVGAAGWSSKGLQEMPLFEPRQTRAVAAKGTQISRLKGESEGAAGGGKLPDKLPLLAFIINMASN